MFIYTLAYATATGVLDLTNELSKIKKEKENLKEDITKLEKEIKK